MNYSKFGKALGVVGLALGLPGLIIGLTILLLELDKKNLLSIKYSVSIILLIIIGFSILVIKHGFKK